MVEGILTAVYVLVTMSLVIVAMNLIACAFTEEEREQSDE